MSHHMPDVSGTGKEAGPQMLARYQRATSTRMPPKMIPCTPHALTIGAGHAWECSSAHVWRQVQTPHPAPKPEVPPAVDLAVAFLLILSAVLALLCISLETQHWKEKQK